MFCVACRLEEEAYRKRVESQMQDISDGESEEEKVVDDAEARRQKRLARMAKFKKPAPVQVQAPVPVPEQEPEPEPAQESAPVPEEAAPEPAPTPEQPAQPDADSSRNRSAIQVEDPRLDSAQINLIPRIARPV